MHSSSRRRRRNSRHAAFASSILFEAIEPRALLSGAVLDDPGTDPPPPPAPPPSQADLAVSPAHLYPPGTHVALAAGDAATAAVTLSNLSTDTDASAPFTGTIYLSHDATLSSDDLTLTSFQAANLPAGSSVPITANVTLPDSSVADTWYTIVAVDQDGAVPDANPDNNVSVSDPVTLVPKTFELVSLTPPTSVRPGEPFTVTGTARVTGLHIDDPSFLTASLRRTGAAAVALTPSLAPIILPIETDGATDPTLVLFSTTFTAPTDCPGGTYTLDVSPTLFKGDGSKATAYKAPAVTVSAAAPALTLAPPTLSTDTLTPGATSLTVTVGVTNSGDAASTGGTAKFYLSATPTYSASASLLGTAPINPLGPDEAQTLTPTFATPSLPAGTYYVIVTVQSKDPAAFSDTSSTTSTALPVTLVAPGPTPDPDPTPDPVPPPGPYPTPGPAPADLSIVALTGPATATAGATIAIATMPSPAVGSLPSTTLVRYYLSPDGTLDHAITLGTLPPAGANYVKLPSNVPAGVYHLVATIDPENLVPEGDETNNTYASPDTVTVYRPDLGATLTPAKTVTVRTQSPGSVTLSLTNPGARRVSRKYTVTYYLSDDQTLSPDDKWFGAQRLTVTLNKKQTKRQPFNFKLPATSVLGTRYVIAVLDTPNASPTAHLEVASAAPVKVVGPRVTAEVRRLKRVGANTQVWLRLTNAGTAAQAGNVLLTLSTPTRKKLYSARRGLNLAPNKWANVVVTVPTKALGAVDPSTLAATVA